MLLSQCVFNYKISNLGKEKNYQALWYTSKIRATQEAEMGRSLFEISGADEMLSKIN
jgi:hypothetical protein